MFRSNRVEGRRYEADAYATGVKTITSRFRVYAFSLFKTRDSPTSPHVPPTNPTQRNPISLAETVRAQRIFPQYGVPKSEDAKHAIIK